ncbi:MAG: hypothetical protein QM706_17440 [Nitrospira sp.]
MFKQAAHNVIEGSRLLKDLMEDYTNVQEKTTAHLEDVEHVGDGIQPLTASRFASTRRS